MNWINLFLFLTISTVGVRTASINTAKSNKTLLYKDATYEEEIRTVRLYPNSGNQSDIFLPPIERLGQNSLFLEFDDLVEMQEEYRVKIIHCNADWTKSNLRNLDYLDDFNEFIINRFSYSVDTKLKYVHYEFRLPRVKVPGNYLLVAYRGDNERDIILSKRFMVYQTNVEVEVLSNLVGLTSVRRENQQIDFNVNYKNFELINPAENIKVVLRQNQRWDNMITIEKPNFIREIQNRLEYTFFDFSNNFPGGSEYRFVDLRSLRYPGQGVQNINLQSHPIQARLMTDQPRIYQAYSQLDDINGSFVIQNNDTGGGNVASDYLYVDFSLAAPEQLQGNVYVVGQMNNYDRNNSNKLLYNSSNNVYKGQLLLKQGFYDYQYIVEADTLKYNYIEGDHFETENEYEILVYYRPMNFRSDLLIGYRNITLNPRN